MNEWKKPIKKSQSCFVVTNCRYEFECYLYPSMYIFNIDTGTVFQSCKNLIIFYFKAIQIR